MVWESVWEDNPQALASRQKLKFLNDKNMEKKTLYRHAEKSSNNSCSAIHQKLKSLIINGDLYSCDLARFREKK